MKTGPRTILLSDLKGQGTFGMKDTESELEKKKKLWSKDNLKGKNVEKVSTLTIRIPESVQ